VGNVNVDLMYALPNQTPEQARADIETAMAFAPPHISAYQLTLEPNTLFHANPPSLPDENTYGAIEDAVHTALGNAGYQRYEVSAFAKNNQRCAHNLNYWKFGDYVGIGAGAHGKISMPNAVMRTVKQKQPQAYMQACETGEPTIERREVKRSEMGFEFMLNVLRLTDGVDVGLFQERTGFPISLVANALQRAEERGLITRDHVHITPTARGINFLNDLQEMFL
jgi:coproporphyrinogen III oxidase-like Fe-S oxidoreductase